MVKQLLRTCFVVDTCKAKKNMFGLRNGGGKLFFTIRAEANFFFDEFQLKYTDKLMENTKKKV